MQRTQDCSFLSTSADKDYRGVRQSQEPFSTGISEHEIQMKIGFKMLTLKALGLEVSANPI